MLEILRGTLQQNLHPPFENYVLARAVDWNGWSGRRLVGTRKAKVKYIGPSPDPKRKADSIYSSIRRRNWRGQRKTLRTGPERLTEQHEQERRMNRSGLEG